MENYNKQKQIESVLKNIKNIQDVKLEDCKIYQEYSVIVLYKNNSEIIVCESSEEANKLYAYLMKNININKQNTNNDLTK